MISAPCAQGVEGLQPSVGLVMREGGNLPQNSLTRDVFELELNDLFMVFSVCFHKRT